MNVLHFTIFTGVESVLPGMSNLGVMIMMGFWYAMQCEGKESKEVLFPDEHESALCGDTVLSLTQPFNGMKSAVMGSLPHYLLLGERPRPLIALFLMMHANTHFR